MITRSGTLGLAILVSKDYDGAVASADFIRIRLKSSIDGIRINPLYVCLIINSEIGRLQIERESVGALQKHVNKESLEQVRIPIPDETAQARILKEFQNAIAEARQLVSEAGSLREKARERIVRASVQAFESASGQEKKSN